MDLISVVIPSYNHTKYIRQAVESVLAQSYKNLELIVIDDGSTDTSLDYLQSLRDPRFTLITQENAGAHNAINKGLSIAKGKYLAILNSDDAFHPERLAECVKHLGNGVDLVATWIEIINEKGSTLGIKEGWRNMLPWPITQPPPHSGAFNDFALNLLMTNFVSTTSNFIFTRVLYETLGGMNNLRFAHDWDFLLRAARSFRCELIEKPLLQYRIHQTNTISSNRSWMLFEICWIYSVHLKKFISELFPASMGAEGLFREVKFLSKSINLQGNDKVMWVLLQYLQEQKMTGVENPENKLLDDQNLRNAFIEQISI